MSKRTIRVATRKSPLAMRQTELAIEALRGARADWEFEILPMSTTGDERLAWSLETSGGKGLFTSALEEAIVKKEADLAVHSAKDLPTEMPEGVALAGFLPRAPANDVLVMREGVAAPALIATSSPRRRAQLKCSYPDAEWIEIRGNIQTRLKKIADGEADASIMARAGFFRMGIEKYAGLTFRDLRIEESVPAAGQGAIGLQVRDEDVEAFHSHLCEQTGRAVVLERAYLAALGGGCHSATAAHCREGVLHCYDELRGYRAFDIPEELDLADAVKVSEWVQSLIR